MDRSDHRSPNPGVIVLIALPLLGPLLIGGGLHWLAGVGVAMALVIGYATCLVAAPPLALLANRLSSRRESRRSRLMSQIQANGAHLTTRNAQAATHKPQ